MKIKMFMNVWRGMEQRYACASAQCGEPSATMKIVSFTVDVPDEYIIGKEDHALGPASNVEVLK